MSLLRYVKNNLQLLVDYPEYAFCSNCRAEVDRDINAMINIKEIAPKKLSVKNNKTASADKRVHGDDSNA